MTGPYKRIRHTWHLHPNGAFVLPKLCVLLHEVIGDEGVATQDFVSAIGVAIPYYASHLFTVV